MFSFGFASTRSSSKAPLPQGTDDDFFDDDEESVGDEINDVLVTLMPWGISIVLHVVLVVVAFYIVWYQIIPAEKEQAVIPEAPLSPNPVVHHTQDESQEETTAAAARMTPNPTTENNSTETIVDFQLPSTPGVTMPSGPQGGGFSDTDGDGEFGVGIFNSGGNAKKIAFVVDASGSMVGVLPFVINELKRSINALQVGQHFTVIFFTGDGVFEVPGGGSRSGIRQATPEWKQDCSIWITLDAHNVEPRGRGSVHAVEAIELALQHKPHLVFLLSDNLTGGGIGATTSEIFQNEIMDAMADANTGNPPAKFNTIQFLYRDPLEDAGLTGTLELIAEETGGVYKFLDDRALHLR